MPKFRLEGVFGIQGDEVACSVSFDTYLIIFDTFFPAPASVEPLENGNVISEFLQEKPRALPRLPRREVGRRAGMLRALLRFAEPHHDLKSSNQHDVNQYVRSPKAWRSWPKPTTVCKNYTEQLRNLFKMASLRQTLNDIEYIFGFLTSYSFWTRQLQCWTNHKGFFLRSASLVSTFRIRSWGTDHFTAPQKRWDSLILYRLSANLAGSSMKHWVDDRIQRVHWNLHPTAWVVFCNLLVGLLFTETQSDVVNGWVDPVHFAIT